MEGGSKRVEGGGREGGRGWRERVEGGEGGKVKQQARRKWCIV